MTQNKSGLFFILRLFVVSITVLASATLSAQEVCGLQSVVFIDAFKNGFETTGTAAVARYVEPIESAPTTIASTPVPVGNPLGIARAIDGAMAPTLAIVYPLSGANIPGKRVQVRGTFTGPENTGVYVNEVAAFIQGNTFITPDINVAAGSFDLVATATTLDGLTATQTRTILGASPATPAVVFGTGPVAGLSTLTVPFSLEFAQATMPQTVSIDFDGNGTADYSGGVPSAAQLRYRYNTPGVFNARATVTSSAPGNPVYVADRLVVVIELAAHRNRICSPYGALRTRLAANDLAGALRVFPSNRRDPMQAVFQAMGTNLPIMAQRLGTIGNGLIGVTEANLTLVSTSATGPVGYPLRVTQGPDGVWRIEAL